jgi:hypothetical protein
MKWSQALSAMLTVLLATNAHADWISNISYSTQVSDSPTGPFGSSANLWTQPVPSGFSPSSLDLYAQTSPVSSDGKKMTIWLASVYASVGNYSVQPGAATAVSNVPFFIKLTLNDSMKHETGYWIVGGELSSKNFWQSLDVTFSGPGTLWIGNDPFRVSPAPPFPLALAIGEYPGETVFTANAIGIGAEIEPAAAPEPSALVLFGVGAAGLIFICGVICGISRRSTGCVRGSRSRWRRSPAIAGA